MGSGPVWLRSWFRSRWSDRPKASASPGFQDGVDELALETGPILEGSAQTDTELT